MVDVLCNALRTLRRLGRRLGPYLLVEMLLPGGTLFALLLFLYRRRSLIADAPRGWGRSHRWTLERCIDRPAANYRFPALVCQE
jgi:hypothetical protein